MGTIKLATASGGSCVLSPTNTASDKTITVPAVDGTMLTTASTFGGTGPAFSAYKNGNQTGVSSGVSTKVQINGETFDTNNCFDSATNYRFTPTTAGYYQISATVATSGTGLTYCIAQLLKNGSVVSNGAFSSASANEYTSIVSSIIYLNGTSDYIELYSLAYASSGSVTIVGNNAYQTYFSGFLARAA